MTNSSRAVALQVRSDSGDHDYHVNFVDESVTIAELLHALDLAESDVAVDGKLIVSPATTAASAVVFPGSRLTTGAQPRTATTVNPGPVHPAHARVRVAVVGGLDAGCMADLEPGLYRIASNASTPDSGWYLQIDAAAKPRPAESAPRQPWHGAAQRIEAVSGQGQVVAFAEPSEPEIGSGAAVHRPPRVLPPEELGPITLPEAPESVRPPSPLSWATLLAPIPIALLMAFFFRPLFALFAAMGPIMALGRWYESRRRFRRATQQRDGLVATARFEVRVKALAYAEDDARLRWLSQPHVAELWRRTRENSVRLWERRPGTAGYLVVTVGVGEDTIEAVVDGAKFDAEIHAAVGAPLTVRAVPHVVDIATSTGVGIHGDRAAALSLARSIILQVATLQGPSDLTIGVLCAADSPLTGTASTQADWDWVKWLPHCNLALVSKSAPALAKEIGVTRADDPQRHVRLIIVDDPNADVAAIERAAHDGDTDVRFVAIAALPTALPAVCSTLLHLTANHLEIASPELAGRRSLVHPVGLSATTATSWARSLSPLVDPEHRSLAARRDGSVGLLRLLGDPSSEELCTQWAERLPERAPCATIGESDEGVVTIDLGADGPHGLIAGTTGSGKSELLRSLVLALAIDVPPDQLNFVLVDFKGGGAFDACSHLPHVAGLITDLDEALVNRAITSLRAELQRRELLFRDLGVSSYEAAVQHVAGRSVPERPEPLPRLLIVVDEFAALATDYKDLMASIIDLAARGRSLGMHLILATQRPSGVVDQKIRANTNLRIALRVQDAYDSQDVVGVPDAALIDRRTPGRAVFSIGGDAPTNVQTAYSGALDARHARCKVRHHSLFPPPNTTEVTASTASTELDVLVAALVEAGDRYGAKVRPLWTAPLPSTLDWIDLGSRALSATSTARGFALGLVDLPDQQTQEPWRWDPDTGSLAVYGASAECSGKTLVAIGAALDDLGERDAAHLYAIDGDAGNVAPLAALPQTGAYITLSETDRIERVVSLFERTLAERRSTHTQASGTKQPAHRMVLLIDNLASVIASYDELGAAGLVERLSNLARDGAPQRVHMAVSARTARDIPHRLAQQMAARITFALADPNGYLALGLRARDVSALPAMRAIDLATQRIVQLAEPPDVRNRAHTSRAVPLAVGSFPATYDRTDLAPATLLDGELVLPIGLESVDLAVVAFRLQRGEHALIVSSSGMGGSTTLLTILHQIERAIFDIAVVRIAPRRSPLAGSALCGTRASTVEELHALVHTAGRETIILVDDAGLVDEAVASALEELSVQSDGPRIIAAATPDFARSTRSWTTRIRQSGSGVLLGGLPTDGDVFRTRLARAPGQGVLPGRGYLVLKGRAQILQIASDEASRVHPPPK